MQPSAFVSPDPGVYANLKGSDDDASMGCSLTERDWIDRWSGQVWMAVAGLDGLSGFESRLPMADCQRCSPSRSGHDFILLPCALSHPSGNGALQVSMGSTQGALFPMERALFFLPKPPLCIPHDEIESYELQRMDASFKASALVLRLKGVPKPLEFGFDRPEVLKLQSYLKERRIKVRGTGAIGRQAGLSEKDIKR